MESSSERENMNGKKTFQRICIYMDSIVLVTLTWKHIKLVLLFTTHSIHCQALISIKFKCFQTNHPNKTKTLKNKREKDTLWWWICCKEHILDLKFRALLWLAATKTTRVGVVLHTTITTLSMHTVYLMMIFCIDFVIGSSTYTFRGMQHFTHFATHFCGEAINHWAYKNHEQIEQRTNDAI